MRRCSRTACSGVAVATLTYAYASSTAVLGPLALQSDPGSYDLCSLHAERTSAPVGWEVIRLPLDGAQQSDGLADDDLVALAAAVREVGLAEPVAVSMPASVRPGERHLRLVQSPTPLG